jgi:hypothetical protein
MIGPNIVDIIKQRKVKAGQLNSLKVSDIPISMLSHGQVIGQEDVINQRNYTTSVKCLTNEASVYVIEGAKFIDKLGRDEKTWKWIVKQSLNKDLSTKKQVKDTYFFKQQDKEGKIITASKDVQMNKNKDNEGMKGSISPHRIQQ